jgi:hypothetical protein
MGTPPFEAGAAHLTEAVVFPAVAVTFCGALGIPGVTDTAAEGAPTIPEAFTATSRIEYVLPFTRVPLPSSMLVIVMGEAVPVKADVKRFVPTEYW